MKKGSVLPLTICQIYYHRLYARTFHGGDIHSMIAVIILKLILFHPTFKEANRCGNLNCRSISVLKFNSFNCCCFFRLQIKKKKKYLPLFVLAKCLAIDKNDNSGRRVDDVTLLIK